MFESPDSLEQLCLETVCENIFTYIEPQMPVKDNWWEKIKYGNSFEEEIGKYRFRDPEIFLINEISENLINKLCEKRMLNDAMLHIFTENNTNLRKVKLKKCRITKNGLQILKQHKIVDLECTNLQRISISDILDCLNEWSTENMRNVNFTNCTFIDELRFSFMVKVANLKNLRSLDLSYTELNQSIFKIICEDLIHLEHINISGTHVNDLTPLLALSSKLKSLFISDLSHIKSLDYIVSKLSLLQYLDISFVKETISAERIRGYYSLFESLEDANILPELHYLDVSGWRELIPKQALLRIFESHPKLEFLGIVLCHVTFTTTSDFQGVKCPQNLTIAGVGNEQQIKVTLQKYKNRASYVQTALFHLFQSTMTFQEAKPDIFNLVLPVMETHLGEFEVQMAATACLYNLTRGELSKHIHPKALSRGVSLTLSAMEMFPERFQLQKNSLLTLCSDRILQDVNFDRFRCARLVLDALCQFSDMNMDRMAVAICSILAAKVSTEETSELGARPQYMHKLLELVERRVDTLLPDITLKFTLSALWNLTDESEATCTVFLEQQGAHLFLNVLKVFKDNSAIETKVLGLLNNIAEVAHLRENLMMEALMDELFVLLKSENIDVSYFAAGIVAHLASDGREHWRVSNHSRDEMIAELESAVTQWKVPDSEMVAYRSFRPFFSLLRVEMDYQVQLWAVWAIHHVCTKNPKRYCQMLTEEKGHLLLKELINCSSSHPEIKRICSQIIQTSEVNL